MPKLAGREKKYEVSIECNAVFSFICKALSATEAVDKAQEFVDSEEFWDRFRRGCDIFTPTICTSVWNDSDEKIEYV